MMIAPEVAVDDVDWTSGDSTLLYNPRFCFPQEELLALTRSHARCPSIVHRELRRDMDSEAIARVFGLEGVGVGDSGGSSSTAGFAADGGGTKGDAGLDDQEPGYVTVESSEEPDYVLVGTADEVQRERRREADAEAAVEAGWNNRVRSIEQLLDDAEVKEEAAHEARRNYHVRRSVEQLLDLDEEADEEEDAITARRKNLVRDIEQFLEEEAALVAAGWNSVVPTIEQHFAACGHQQRSGRPE